MGILSNFLGLLGLGSRSPAVGSGAAPGTLSAPPELTSQTEEGFHDLVFFIERCEVQPLGSQVLHASAVHRGLHVGIEVVLGPEWREGTFADQPSYQGLVTYRSAGPGSDALLRIMDELWGTKAAPRAMARMTDFTCVTLSGDPRDLLKGPVHAKLFFEAEEEGSQAELYTNVDLAAKRLEIREKDPDYRAAIVRALVAGSAG